MRTVPLYVTNVGKGLIGLVGDGSNAWHMISTHQHPFLSGDSRCCVLAFLLLILVCCLCANVCSPHTCVVVFACVAYTAILAHSRMYANVNQVSVCLCDVHMCWACFAARFMPAPCIFFVGLYATLGVRTLLLA